MADASFSPRDFKAWVIEETDTGNNAGALFTNIQELPCCPVFRDRIE